MNNQVNFVLLYNLASGLSVRPVHLLASVFVFASSFHSKNFSIALAAFLWPCISWYSHSMVTEVALLCWSNKTVLLCLSSILYNRVRPYSGYCMQTSCQFRYPYLRVGQKAFVSLKIRCLEQTSYVVQQLCSILTCIVAVLLGAVGQPIFVTFSFPVRVAIHWHVGQSRIELVSQKRELLMILIASIMQMKIILPLCAFVYCIHRSVGHFGGHSRAGSPVLSTRATFFWL